jgi:signal transduction histidine kinase
MTASNDGADYDGESQDAQVLLEHLAVVEARLDELHNALIHSHRLATLGTMASAIAHEYNNILTPIISYAQLALARPDDTALLHKAVERALSGAERAAAISSSILGFARDGDDSPQAFLPTTIDDALQCLAREPSKDGIELEVDLPQVSIEMSPLALEQVIVNLVLNARKAMKRRGGRLRIAAVDGGAEVRLSVSDTGPGIPPEVMDRLFEPFVTHSIGEGKPARREGTGLGLCICKRLVEQAGGTIDVESEPGKGASFEIVVPRVKDAAMAA